MSKLTKTIGSITVAVIFVLVTAIPVNADNIHQDGTYYKIEITIKALSAGKKEATIKITPKPTYHNNMQYPWKLKLDSGPNLPEQKIYRKGDASPFTEQNVTFKITTGNSATEKVKATLKMSQCNNKQCWTSKEKLEW